ncbi:MAG: dienelactone hydrolase family protein [Parvularculaceae bacterium]
MRQDIIDLYDAFTHGAMARRDFLKRLARLAGGAAAASALISLLENDYARAAVVAADDARIKTSYTEFDFARLTGAYVAEPADRAGPTPAVIVIHENRGLNPHIEDVARRLAVEGFGAYAVDMLTPFGGTPNDEDEARKLIRQLDAVKTTRALAAIAAYLKAAKTHNGKVGALGFCWGGGMVNRLAAAAPGLDAGVAYYGRQIAAEEAAKIRAAMLLHYAGLDSRINSGIADYEKALKAAGVDYRLYMYEGAQHAFNNDTNEARYDKAAAMLAWSRTTAFFREKLA